MKTGAATGAGRAPDMAGSGAPGMKRGAMPVMFGVVLIFFLINFDGVVSSSS